MKRKQSKRYKQLVSLSKDGNKEVISEAIKKVKKNCNSKFDESLDLSLVLNLKSKKEETNLRTVVNLPHGNGKKIKIAVLCEDSKINEAKESGAEIFGSDNLINDITAGKINFDKLVATPAMMSKIGKLGKILGPKGLMPNPKLGTVTNDIKKSFTDEKIKENYEAFMQTVSKEKPSGIKGDFIISAFLTSTMGVSYKLKLKV